MASQPLSWAAVASKNIKPSVQPPQRTSPNPSPVAAAQPAAVIQTSTTIPTAAIPVRSEPASTNTTEQVKPRIAFISGHIDITASQFSENYASLLDTAIARGDTFVLSNAGGVDTLALAYLRSKGVSPARTTIYMHTARQNRKLNATQQRINKMRLGPEVEERYRREGYGQVVIRGYHNERDAAMTEASDYDILWLRSDEDTARLYGEKYRPGRVSGTQKNRDRRAAKEEKLTRLANQSESNDILEV